MGITSILLIIQTTLSALGTIPAIGADAALGSVFVQILQSALTAYHSAAGVPLDITKLPLETPVV